MEANKVNVIFLEETDDNGNTDVLAVFPDIKERHNEVLCYRHIGQHSSCHTEYIAECEEAKDHKDLLSELESIGYDNLNVVTKIGLKNKNTSLREVEYFMNSKPEKYFGYPSKDKTSLSQDIRLFTTWIGDKLGTITWKGQSYKSNMGDVRVPVDVIGINGCRYSGTMYGGNYIRLKRLKRPYIVVTMQRIDIPNEPLIRLEYRTMKSAKKVHKYHGECIMDGKKMYNITYNEENN